jgi:hypothetical protein
MYMDLLYPAFLVTLLWLLCRKRMEDGIGR